MQSRVVGKESVRELAVVAERLAVIGGDDGDYRGRARLELIEAAITPRTLRRYI